MAARYGHLINKWTVAAVAALVVMAALLAATLPAWAQTADRPPAIPNAPTMHDHNENDPNSIYRYRAADPERLKVFWTLSGPDAADFTIDGGTLSFKSPPNYESPTDRANDEDGSGGALDPTDEGAGNNIYKVTVRFGGGGEDGAPEIGDDYAGDDVGTIDVTVTVMNVDEDGSVAISPLQPQVGTTLTGTLTDLDGQIGEGEWQWASADSMSGPFTPITSFVDKGAQADANTYRPVVGDTGKYLRVTVRYKDRAGDQIKTEQAVSDYPVRAATEDDNNDAPIFPSQGALDPDTADTTVATTRYIPENSAVGTPVGAPVTAKDDDKRIDVITYSLSDTTPDSDHSTNFDIDPATGQITVSTSASLNVEGDDAITSYAVTVTAVDGDGEDSTIPVTINVVPVDESPMITMGPTEMSHVELDRTNSPATEIDTNLDTAGITAGTDDAVYTADDPEDVNSTLTWSLEGPDGGMFAIDADAADGVQDIGETATLSFKKGPDFEKPGDTNKDNVYEVTLVVTDSTWVNMGKYNVTVKVLNSTEDNKAGKVTLSNRQPEDGTALMASHTDPDGGVTSRTWQWARSATGTEGEACDVDIDDDALWTNIANATSATYTPAVADVSTCLRAMVTYRDAVDPTTPTNDPDTPQDDTLEKVSVSSERRVLAEDTDNTAPVFRTNPGAATPGAPVSSYTRVIAENTDADMAIGSSIAATDGTVSTTDGTVTADDAILTYILSGTDASSFNITGSVDYNSTVEPTDLSGVADGILYTKEDLDYEEKRTYTVTVTATDPSNVSDSVTVTITITDVDEAPEFTDGEERVRYLENGTGPIDQYTAKDPEKVGMIYSLVAADDATVTDAATLAADVALFNISSIDGTLKFRPNDDNSLVRPNYEMAEDAGFNNLYQVVVRAVVADATDATSPGGATVDPVERADRAVTIMVTNEDEPPMFPKTTDTLEIEENPDDPERKPVLNRDVDDPVRADDDDSTSTRIIGGTADATGVDRIDGLTYTLSGGADAGPFHIVPATGQILTMEKLDYEDPQNTDHAYSVTVTATDTTGLSDSIEITIEVTDVDEVPAAGPLTVLGPNSLTYAENGKDAVGPFQAVGTGADMAMWAVEGTDADLFKINGSGNSVVLEFRDSPNYEMPMGGAADDSNTYNVTVKIAFRDDMDEQPVQVIVENVDELGTLTGTDSKEHPENGMDALDTYTVNGTMKDEAMWSLEGADMGQFMLDTDTGSSVTLAFMESPNYEMPRGMAKSDDNTNTYMVTVKAEAGGETLMRDVTITVTNVDDNGMVAIMPQPQTLRPGTELTATLSDDDGSVRDISWQWSKSMDKSSWMDISGATSMTYTPMATDDEYYLRAMAMYTDSYGSGKSATSYPTGMVNAIQDQMGSVSLSPMSPVVGTMLTASLSDGNGGVTGQSWQWSKSMSMDGTFMDITDATSSGSMSSSYTPTAADEGYYLRATVMYTDAHGPDKEEMATTTAKVSSTPPDPNAALIARYDSPANGGNGNGTIDKAEVIAAINDYLFPQTGVDPISKADVIALINLYLFPGA